MCFTVKRILSGGGSNESGVKAILTEFGEKISELLKDFRVIVSRSDTRLCVITDFSDVACLEKMLSEMLREYDRTGKILISIGISNVYDGIREIPSAFNTAKFVAKNKLFAAISSVSTDNGNTKLYKKNVVDALAFVSENYTRNDLTVKIVADSLCVSESYLMHLFKDNLGKTFNTCLTEYRIMMAKKYLLEEKYRVCEIAEMVGYYDVKYFGQVFRKNVGTTPSEYIRRENEKKKSQ